VQQFGVRVLIQPSTKRIFTDKEYEQVSYTRFSSVDRLGLNFSLQAGAEVTDDLTDANCIMSVKEFPKTTTKDKNRAYILFAHVIKAQRQVFLLFPSFSFSSEFSSRFFFIGSLPRSFLQRTEHGLLG
jgi:hypothetical protein